MKITLKWKDGKMKKMHVDNLIPKLQIFDPIPSVTTFELYKKRNRKKTWYVYEEI